MNSFSNRDQHKNFNNLSMQFVKRATFISQNKLKMISRSIECRPPAKYILLSKFNVPQQQH